MKKNNPKTIAVGKRNGSKARVSVCVCGHTGDAPYSQHENSFQKGHGACKECKCPQFVWKRWL